MDSQLILSAVWNVVDEIKSSVSFITLHDKANQLRSLSLYQEYLQAKAAYLEVVAIGKFHPDFQDKKQTFIQCKTALCQTDEYRLYLEAKEVYTKELKKVVDEINQPLQGLTIEKTKSCSVRST